MFTLGTKTERCFRFIRLCYSLYLVSKVRLGSKATTFFLFLSDVGDPYIKYPPEPGVSLQASLLSASLIKNKQDGCLRSLLGLEKLF